MPRFFCPPPIPASGSFYLPPNAVHHATRVLRLRQADPVQIFDGLGKEFHGVIAELGNKHVKIDGISVVDIDRESPLDVQLAQALTNSEKMDWVMQKATELGVTEIQPVVTERSVARLAADRIAKRIEHWQQVAISACEQCGRNILPQINTPLDIMEWLQRMRDKPFSKYILLPEGTASLSSQTKPQGKVALLTGAEGGFSQAESEAAQLCGFITIRMGSRVMRTETAAIAGIAALQTLWGDFQ